jgi:serine/threonine protein kinase
VEGTRSSTPLSSEKYSYSLYLLFFYRAWQEDGHFLCQTELCCRDTCRELLDSLRFLWNTAKNKYPSLLRRLPSHDNVEPGCMDDVCGRQLPNETVWKICHDIAAGLSHIHLHGMVHHDIKPSNIFFVSHPRFGAMCKIGDFGMAGEIGTSAEGLEGDTRYMPPELLSSGKRHPRADIFSLGLTIYEIATDVQIEMPAEGAHWHYLRSSQGPSLPSARGDTLQKLVLAMTDPVESNRPTADAILQLDQVQAAGQCCDNFLRDYIHDIDAFDQMEEARLAMESHEEQTPRNSTHRQVLSTRSPGLSMLLTNSPSLFSPPVVRKQHKMH